MINKIEEYFNILQNQLGESQRAFNAIVLGYYGASGAAVSVIDDPSPHRIKTPAIRVGNILYEGPVRVGQAIVILQRKFLGELVDRELSDLADDFE